jgi:hypothetical protein
MLAEHLAKHPVLLAEVVDRRSRRDYAVGRSSEDDDTGVSDCGALRSLTSSIASGRPFSAASGSKTKGSECRDNAFATSQNTAETAVRRSQTVELG